jgi:hypothetical protein
MGPCQLRLAAAALVVPVFGITLALAADETFTKPTFKGYRLAYCIDRGSGCGKRAANALCQYLGLGDASKFAVDPDVGRKTPTRITIRSATNLTATDSSLSVALSPLPERRLSTSRNGRVIASTHA